MSALHLLPERTRRCEVVVRLRLARLAVARHERDLLALDEVVDAVRADERERGTPPLAQPVTGDAVPVKDRLHALREAERPRVAEVDFGLRIVCGAARRTLHRVLRRAALELVLVAAGAALHLALLRVDERDDV